MPKTNEKIGILIQNVRQERGLTQSQLAKALGTSQSAINRIEKGNQNLSINMIGKISDILNKPILHVDSGATNLRIEGGHQLSGSITLKKSKNAAVALLCASLLNKGVTRFKCFPKIEEVHRIIETLESIGVKIKWTSGGDVEIRRPEKLDLDGINIASAKKTRSVVMFLGALMHEYKDFKIPYAGGCKLGARTVTPHLYALEQFGVDIETRNHYYRVHSRPKSAKRVVLYEAGNTVTNNALLAASMDETPTVIQGASADYMVQDLCAFLKRLGVKIDGVGSPVLTVTGVSGAKKNISFSPTEDPIEAMFFISAAVTTNSSITIKRTPIHWIGLELLKLQKMGLKCKVSEPYPSDDAVTELADLKIEKHNGNLHSPIEKIHPNLWPGLNPDNIPYFVPICATAKGRTLIHDWMFENRAIYYTELTKIGAHIELADPHRLFITGPTKWENGDVSCPPALRPASLLLIGMLAADGISTLRNVYTINRGYEDIAKRLNSLGAKITVLSEI